MTNEVFSKDNRPKYDFKSAPPNERKINPRIIIEFIDHQDQRYDTVGDYFDSGQLGEIFIKISRMKDERYQMLVAIHELIEMTLCRDRGISNEVIDKFDMNWKPQPEFGNYEPGDDPRCPYFQQHQTALDIEHHLAEEMGIDWDDYNEYVGTFVKSGTK